MLRSMRLPEADQRLTPYRDCTSLRRTEAMPHVGHRHLWQREMGRRQFMRGAAAVAGLAFGSGLVLPAIALAETPRGRVAPIPIPGGDVLGLPDFPFQIHQFLPGTGSGFDGLDAEPNGITNFRGLAALGYISGTATDNKGRAYTVQTDNRIYQGEWVGADGRHAHGTLVEI